MQAPTANGEYINESCSEEPNTPLSQSHSKTPSSPQVPHNQYGSYLKAPYADVRVLLSPSKLQPKADAAVSDRKQLNLTKLAMDKLKSPTIRS